jgi:S-adenosylmethionine hydrolase
VDSKKPIITILSDWSVNDFYTAALKGRILSICPEANIIDIAHQITTFNTSSAAFILANTFRFYPKGTIHLICVGTEKNDTNDYVFIEAFNQYFIGTDNGIFGFLFADTATKILALDIKKLKKDEHFLDLPTFPELDIFALLATKIAKEEKIEDYTLAYDELKLVIPFRPTIDENVISGRVIYIDSYKNAITNITKNLFTKERKGRKFELVIKSMNNKVTKINKKYNESSSGELLALFNSLDLLEIAQSNGKVCDVLNIDTDTTLRINFYDN